MLLPVRLIPCAPAHPTPQSSTVVSRTRSVAPRSSVALRLAVPRPPFGRSLAHATLVATGLGVGCGGAVAPIADGGADGSVTDAPPLPIDGSSTACVASGGDSVCGGPNHCPAS